MSSNSKNKNSQDRSGKLAQVTRRYTTRQIMELTEKRRQQMDEEAKLRERLKPIHPVELNPTPKAGDQAVTVDEPQISLQSSDHSTLNLEISQTNQVVNTAAEIQTVAIPQESTISEESTVEPVVDGKTVAGLFRETAQLPAEQEVSRVIEEEFNKAVDWINPVENRQELQAAHSPAIELESQANPQEGQVKVSLDVPSKQSSDIVHFQFTPQDSTEPLTNESVEAPLIPVQADPKSALNVSVQQANRRKLLNEIWETIFFGLSFSLMALMLIHILQEGWGGYYYDQSPFVLLMGIVLVWLNRKNFVKRQDWFLGSTVIIAGGLGVFIAAAIENHVHIQLASFLIVSFGLFLWRYEEEHACRLLFPLATLMFIFSPPTSWQQVMQAPFNEWVYHVSFWAINSFHTPVHYDGTSLQLTAGKIAFLGDPTVYRTIIAASLLALVSLSFQTLATAWSAVLLASVIFWSFVANIVRVVTTGLMLDNFGYDYAAAFFYDYSTYLVLFILIAGISVTSGLLPHKEDFE